MFAFHPDAIDSADKTTQWLDNYGVDSFKSSPYCLVFEDLDPEKLEEAGGRSFLAKDSLRAGGEMYHSEERIASGIVKCVHAIVLKKPNKTFPKGRQAWYVRDAMPVGNLNSGSRNDVAPVGYGRGRGREPWLNFWTFGFSTDATARTGLSVKHRMSVQFTRYDSSLDDSSLDRWDLILTFSRLRHLLCLLTPCSKLTRTGV